MTHVPRATREEHNPALESPVGAVTDNQAIANEEERVPHGRERTEPMSDSATERSWVIHVCPKCRRETDADEHGCCVHCGEWFGGEGTGDDDHTVAVEVVPAALLDEALEAMEDAAGRFVASPTAGKLGETASHIRQSLHEEKGT